jgi:hypothetical protein
VFGWAAGLGWLAESHEIRGVRCPKRECKKYADELEAPSQNGLVLEFVTGRDGCVWPTARLGIPRSIGSHVPHKRCRPEWILRLRSILWAECST